MVSERTYRRTEPCDTWKSWHCASSGSPCRRCPPCGRPARARDQCGCWRAGPASAEAASRCFELASWKTPRCLLWPCACWTRTAFSAWGRRTVHRRHGLGPATPRPQMVFSRPSWQGRMDDAEAWTTPAELLCSCKWAAFSTSWWGPAGKPGHRSYPSSGAPIGTSACDLAQAVSRPIRSAQMTPALTSPHSGGVYRGASRRLAAHRRPRHRRPHAHCRATLTRSGAKPSARPCDSLMPASMAPDHS